MDSTTNKERIEKELSELASKFAEIYVTDGIKAGRTALLEILSVAMKYEKRMVLLHFRLALRSRGVLSVRELIN